MYETKIICLKCLKEGIILTCNNSREIRKHLRSAHDTTDINKYSDVVLRDGDSIKGLTVRQLMARRA